MLLRNLHAAVTQQHRNALHGHTCLKQADGERIAEAVGVAVWNSGLLEYALPRLGCAVVAKAWRAGAIYGTT
jgi:hypothetical protein